MAYSKAPKSVSKFKDNHQDDDEVEMGLNFDLEVPSHEEPMHAQGSRIPLKKKSKGKTNYM